MWLGSYAKEKNSRILDEIFFSKIIGWYTKFLKGNLYINNSLCKTINCYHIKRNYIYAYRHHIHLNINNNIILLFMAFGGMDSKVIGMVWFIWR